MAIRRESGGYLRRLMGGTYRTRTQWQSRCVHDHPFTSPSIRTQRIVSRPRIQQERHAGSFAGNAQKLFRSSPFSMTLATAIILFGIFSLGYANYYYQHFIIKPYHNFPEPVAVKLRRAVYFSSLDFQPGEALKYYKQALQLAEELGMDPFSDEIMGVKIQVAAVMEKAHRMDKAAEVLEIVRRDALMWIDRYGDLDKLHKKKRTRVLAKCVAISVKLSELYAHRDLYITEAAEERLIWAVETALKEQQRRTEHQVSDEDEGPWLTGSEIGASFEALAQLYGEKNLHYLASPLYLQALSLHPTTNCHTVVLMNNLATSLAQQSPQAADAVAQHVASTTLPFAPAPPAPTREAMIENATTWTRKALDVAAGIKPPLRDEECDTGCAVALHNLGEFAEMRGMINEAKAKYSEALSLAKAIGFHDGVKETSARLKSLNL